jgi:hypothetical protein
MSISRRNFLQAGSIALLSTGTPLCLTSWAAQRTSQKGTSMTGRNLMSKATFAALLNTPFLILPRGNKRVRVELIQIEDRVSKPDQQLAARTGKECFSLAFRPSSYARLKQDTYRMQHSKLGNFDLFIGPIESKKHGMIYEAIINHVSR